MKKFLISIAVIAIITIYWFVTALDGRVKEHIEKIGMQSTGVPVSVDSVAISVFNGSGTINGLKIPNPEGYSDANAFEIKSIRFDVDLGTAFSQPLVFNNLVFDSPLINIEMRDDDEVNIKEIINVNRRHNRPEREKSKRNKKKKTDGGNTEDEQTEETETEEENETEIKQEEEEYYRMYFANLEVINTTFNAERKSDQWSGTLEGISMKELGGEQGIGTKEVGLLVISQLARKAIKVAARRKATDVLEEKTKELGEKLLESLLEKSKEETN